MLMFRCVNFITQAFSLNHLILMHLQSKSWYIQCEISWNWNLFPKWHMYSKLHLQCSDILLVGINFSNPDQVHMYPVFLLFWCCDIRQRYTCYNYQGRLSLVTSVVYSTDGWNLFYLTDKSEWWCCKPVHTFHRI